MSCHADGSHPPFVPAFLQVSLLKDTPNPTGILRSKATGEPPYALANSIYFAAKRAIASAREDAGNTGTILVAVTAGLGWAG